MKDELPDDSLLATAIQNLGRLQNHHPKRAARLGTPYREPSHIYEAANERFLH
jgi:hypothetical protein